MSAPSITSNILPYQRPSSILSASRSKLSDDAMRQREARYQAVLHSATDAIITADSSGIIIEWNEGAERMFTYTPAEAVGQPLTLLIPQEFRADHEKGMARLQSGDSPHVIGKTVELKGMRKNGTLFPMELSLASWQDTSGTFYTSIIRDITDRKQA
jgi:PAS domain S-box-containing protein